MIAILKALTEGGEGGMEAAALVSKVGLPLTAWSPI